MYENELDVVQQAEVIKEKYDHDVRKRFFKKIVRQPNGCWIWIAAKNGNGYPCFKLHGKTILATHASYEIHRKMLRKPDEKMLHDCDTPCCVNPNHLHTGTSQKNSDEMVQRGRSTYGEKNAQAKLNWGKVNQIRDWFSNKKMCAVELAYIFNISLSQVYQIVSLRSWKPRPE